MRKFNAMIAGAALICGVAAVAAAQRPGPMRPMQGQGRGGRMGAMITRQLFRGITLTDAQKTQMQKLRDGNRAQMQTLGKSAQADREALRTAREQGDTIALRAARQKIEGDRNRAIAYRGQFQQSVRGVLTADQQKQFDANRTRVHQRVAMAGRAMRQERMRFRHQAMMRAFMPRRGGFGPGARWNQRGGPGMMGPGMMGRGGMGPSQQRGFGPPGGRGGLGPQRRDSTKVPPPAPPTGG